MQLSPLNRLGIRARIFGWTEAEQDERSGGKIEEVVMYRCPVCRELHDWESDAEKCCQEARENKESGPACPVCGAGFETHRDAADCCLWKDIGAHTRWRIADAVQAGSEWATELGLTQNDRGVGPAAALCGRSHTTDGLCPGGTEGNEQ